MGEIPTLDTKIANKMGLIELNKRLKQLRDGLLIELLEDTINEESDLIVKYNRNQLLQGLKSDKTLMPTYRSKENKNKSKNGRIILYDTGDFQSMIFAQANNKKISIFSYDVKAELLAGRYGNMIFGLTDENQSKFILDILPKIRLKIENFLAQ